jgi:hypothetical protein
MKKNMGMVDRVLRLALAVVVAILYFAGAISGTVAIILGIIAVIFLVTGLVGVCPLCMLFGISTSKNK